MERERLRWVQRALRKFGRRRRNRQQRYTDAAIVEVYYWAVINDRPVDWACRPENWPRGLRRGPLPSQSLMSRRLRTVSVLRLLGRIEEAAVPKPEQITLACVMDGKPLPIARHSGDRQAGFGRGVGNKAKGYKFHGVIDLQDRLVKWSLAPLNIDERVMAERLIRDLPPCAYLLADAHYDSNKLFGLAASRGIQLVVPRRYGRDKGLGNRQHHPARLRSKHLLEENFSSFGRELLTHRRRIERFFASLTNFGGGLTCLPPWVRTYRRVHAWVQAKLVIAHINKYLRGRSLTEVVA